MVNLNKINKSIGDELQRRILAGEIHLYDSSGNPVHEIQTTVSKYKLTLGNNKKFMKKYVDRKITVTLTSMLRDTDIAFLYRILSYIDEENCVDMKKLKIDFGYSDSKLSKAKKPLVDRGILRNDEYGCCRLNPLVGVMSKEIPQELITLFNDTYHEYGVSVTY